MDNFAFTQLWIIKDLKGTGFPTCILKYLNKLTPPLLPPNLEYLKVPCLLLPLGTKWSSFFILENSADSDPSFRSYCIMLWVSVEPWSLYHRSSYVIINPKTSLESSLALFHHDTSRAWHMKKPHSDLFALFVSRRIVTWLPSRLSSEPGMGLRLSEKFTQRNEWLIKIPTFAQKNYYGNDAALDGFPFTCLIFSNGNLNVKKKLKYHTKVYTHNMGQL